MTKVLGPVGASVPDSSHAVSDAVTVMSVGALLPGSAGFASSLAWQLVNARPARAAVAVAIAELRFTWRTFRVRVGVGETGRVSRAPSSGAGRSSAQRRGRSAT